MENGGTRTYEIYKDKKKLIQKIEADDEQLEKLDPMNKVLENRVLGSQKEMADLDTLDKIKAMNMRHLKMMLSMKNSDDGATQMDVADLVLKKARYEEEEIGKEDTIELDEEDEALIKTIQFGKQHVIKTSNGKQRNHDESNMIRIKEKEKIIIRRRSTASAKNETKNVGEATKGNVA